jgi:phytanoyl-CoA hydroxylase
MLQSLKQFVKKQLVSVPKEFDYDTLPWIDKKDADISNFVANFEQGRSLPYNLAEKLSDWQNNGYVVLNQVLPHDWIDTYLAEVEELIVNREKYKNQVRIDTPEYAHNPIQSVCNVPEEVLRGKYLKINDFHNSSIAGKKIMLHPSITGFLNAIFGQQVVAMQSLTFMNGSQQATHMDFAYVVSQNPSHLAAAWIALEDVHADSGPLYYYRGSHKIRKFNFGNGIFFNEQSTKNPAHFAKYLDNECKNLKRETLLIKKGDVLFWHAALAHGGEAIKDPNRTRKSYVCHYSSASAYTNHRCAPSQEPIRYEYANGVVFENPLFPDQENIFKAGEKW